MPGKVTLVVERHFALLLCASTLLETTQYPSCTLSIVVSTAQKPCYDNKSQFAVYQSVWFMLLHVIMVHI